MAQLRRDYRRFKESGTEVVVVGPEAPETFAAYWREHDLPFRGLPDPSHRVLKLYGQQTKIFKLGRMPAQALIDKTGTIRFVHYGHEMSDIPSNEEILGLVEALDTAAVGTPPSGQGT
jgi:peroxiredoxin Q/BCP